MAETWLVCSEPSCRTAIEFGARHWVCSVSTCNRSRTRLVFCSVTCWDAHLGEARHRDAGAIEARAPSKDAWQRELASEPAPRPAPAPPRQTPAQGTRPAQPASHRGIVKFVTPPEGVPIRREPQPANNRAGIVKFVTPPEGVPVRPAQSFETPEPVQPRSGPAATPDSVQPRSGPAPTPDSVQPSRVVVAAPPAPARRVVGETSPVLAATMEGVHLADIVDRDMLIVISKLKKYIKDRSGMNCSDAVAEVLSDHVRVICDDSIRAAARDERKTVLDRDVPRPRR